MTRFGLAVALAICCAIIPAQAKDKIAFAYCPMTHFMGHGSDPDLTMAEDKAKNDCAMKGGWPKCCATFYGEDTSPERIRIVTKANKLNPGN